MNEFVELCYGILFSPRRTFTEMGEHPPLQSALLIVVLVNALQILLNGAIGSADQLVKDGQVGTRMSSVMEPFLELLNSPGFIIIMSVVAVVLALCWLFIKSAMFHLVAELLGGTGSARAVMAVLGASQFPMVLVIPVYLLVYLLGLSPALSAGVALLVSIYTAFILPVQGIARVHNFSTSKAVATVASPMVAFFVVLVLFSALLIGSVSLLSTVLK